MTQEQYEALPSEQRTAMLQLWKRSTVTDWHEFRDLAFETGTKNDMYVGINLHGMFYGIEKDGYTHT